MINYLRGFASPIEMRRLQTTNINVRIIMTFNPSTNLKQVNELECSSPKTIFSVWRRNGHNFSELQSPNVITFGGLKYSSVQNHSTKRLLVFLSTINNGRNQFLFHLSSWLNNTFWVSLNYFLPPHQSDTGLFSYSVQFWKGNMDYSWCYNPWSLLCKICSRIRDTWLIELFDHASMGLDMHRM